MRRSLHARATLAGTSATEADGPGELRHIAARRWPLLVRVLLVPPALVAAALGGALFAILLPICGIATIAEGMARGGWTFARDILSQTRGLFLRNS